LKTQTAKKPEQSELVTDNDAAANTHNRGRNSIGLWEVGEWESGRWEEWECKARVRVMFQFHQRPFKWVSVLLGLTTRNHLKHDLSIAKYKRGAKTAPTKQACTKVYR
jgi:hypothetical protein